MSIVDDVIKTIEIETKRLEEENERLHAQLLDLQLVRDTLMQLIKIVDGMVEYPNEPLSEIDKGTEHEAGAENEVEPRPVASQQYIVTEHGDDVPSLPYKVDPNQFIPDY